MAIRVPLKQVDQPQHLLVPYGNPGAQGGGVLIVHTGWILFQTGSAGGSGVNFEDVVSFVPYSDGKLQTYGDVGVAAVVSASLSAVKFDEQGDQDYVGGVNHANVEVVTQNSLVGDPKLLVLRARVGVRRGVLHRISYQVTVQVTDQELVGSLPSASSFDEDTAPDA